MITDDPFKNFATLKKLHCSMCKYFTRQGLNELLEKCPKMEYMKLEKLKYWEALYFLECTRKILQSRTNNIPLIIQLDSSSFRVIPIRSDDVPYLSNYTEVIFEIGEYDVVTNNFISRKRLKDNLPVTFHDLGHRISYFID